MSEAHLFETVAQAALDCGKRLRVLDRRRKRTIILSCSLYQKRTILSV